jgi:hypothetical protein
MGLLSSVAKIFGAAKQKKAIGKASAAQQAAAQQGIDLTQGQIATTQSGLSDTLAGLLPFLTQGQQAVTAQGNLLGLGGAEDQSQAIAALKASPLFQSLYHTGEEAVLQNASATGGLRGGNLTGSLANFGSDTLAKVIQQQLAGLGGLSAQGLSAAGTGAQARTATSGITGDLTAQIAALLGQQGSAKAGGILGKANANQQIYDGIASGIGDIVGAIAGGGGSGASTAQAIGAFI